MNLSAKANRLKEMPEGEESNFFNPRNYQEVTPSSDQIVTVFNYDFILFQGG